MVVLASGNALQCTVARMGEYLQALNNKEQHVLFDFVDCLVVLVFSRTLHGFDCNTQDETTVWRSSLHHVSYGCCLLFFLTFFPGKTKKG